MHPPNPSDLRRVTVGKTEGKVRIRENKKNMNKYFARISSGIFMELSLKLFQNKIFFFKNGRHENRNSLKDVLLMGQISGMIKIKYIQI